MRQVYGAIGLFTIFVTILQFRISPIRGPTAPKSTMERTVGPQPAWDTSGARSSRFDIPTKASLSSALKVKPVAKVPAPSSRPAAPLAACRDGDEPGSEVRVGFFRGGTPRRCKRFLATRPVRNHVCACVGTPIYPSTYQPKILGGAGLVYQSCVSSYVPQDMQRLPPQGRTVCVNLHAHTQCCTRLSIRVHA